MGIITKGMGVILKHAKKAKPKKAERTAFKIKPHLKPFIKQFKKSKKHGLKDKFGVWSNRQAAVTIEQMGKGVTIKFKKSGMPHVSKGTKPSTLTKAKGWSKVIAPIGAYTYLSEKNKDKKK
jgi:predicted DsbA family dithiol-disulfide isomerase|tara:strand:- start:223 stop:588 length:366 start_codon:yes stop_codon:yes gene_type:complete